MLAHMPPLIPPQRRGAGLVFELREARSFGELREFAGVGARLHRRDRRWIPALGLPAVVDPRRNPLLEGGNLAAFTAIGQNLGLGDEPAGRVAAWFTSRRDEIEPGVTGWWGLFEAMNTADVADRLFYEAENWLFEHAPGLQGILGPGSLDLLTPPGLLTDGFDAAPTAFVPYNPPYYPEMVEGQGYEPETRWQSFSLTLPASTHGEVGQGVRALSLRELPPGWQAVSRLARQLAQEGETADSEIRLNEGLVQWLRFLASEGTLRLHPAHLWALQQAFRRAVVVLAEEDGEPVAACYGAPDMARALRLSGGRLISFGWLSFSLALARSQRLRVFPAFAPAEWGSEKLAGLYAGLAHAATIRGFRELLVAPIDEEDEGHIHALTSLGARSIQTFTVYRKDF